VDAVREFKVTNSLMSAESGHTGIGVVNLQLKSGTNQFQGTAFEYLRNDKLDARSWLASTRITTGRTSSALRPAARYSYRSSTTAEIKRSSSYRMPDRGNGGATDVSFRQACVTPCSLA
jgi:hypothetical protein